MGRPNVNVAVGGPKKPDNFTYKTVILKNNIGFAEQIGDEDRMYVIKWDFIIGEIKDITVTISSSNVSYVENPVYPKYVANLEREQAELQSLIESGASAAAIAAEQAIVYSWQDRVNKTSRYYYYQTVTIPANKVLHIKNRGLVFLNTNRDAILSRDYYLNDTDSELTVYVGSVVANTYELREDYYINIPKNCILKFEGGSVSNGTIVLQDTVIESYYKAFDNVIVTGTCGNDVPETMWFGLDGKPTYISSPSVQALFDGQPSEVIFNNGTYNIQNVAITNNVVIKGLGEATIVGQPLIEWQNGFDFIFKSSGVEDIYIKDIRITGQTPLPTPLDYQLGNPLLYFNNGTKVTFDNILFDTIKTFKVYAWPDISDAVSLFRITDFNETFITNCEFKDCAWRNGEMTWIDYKNKAIEDTSVTYSKNYAHNTPDIYSEDAHNCTTILTVECGRLTIENNVVENIVYGGSTFNAFGYYTTITNNIVKNCVATSVFDTCEYGAHYSKQVYISDNVVDCLNAVMVLTTSKIVEIKNNIFKGLSIYAAGSKYYNRGIEADTPENVAEYKRRVAAEPQEDLVVIENNTIDCDHYDSAYHTSDASASSYGLFSGKHGINIGSFYSFGKRAVIKNNDIKFTTNDTRFDCTDRSPINFKNFKNAIIEGNHIHGLLPYLPGSPSYRPYIYIRTAKSVDFDKYDNPTVFESFQTKDNIIEDPMYRTIDGQQRYIYPAIYVKPDRSTVPIDDPKYYVGFEYLDIRNLYINDPVGTYLVSDTNVGVFNADTNLRSLSEHVYKGYKIPNIYTYDIYDYTDPDDPTIAERVTIKMVSCIEKGHELIDSDILFARTDTCAPDYDAVDDSGKIIRAGSVVSINDANWQLLGESIEIDENVRAIQHTETKTIAGVETQVEIPVGEIRLFKCTYAIDVVSNHTYTRRRSEHIIAWRRCPDSANNFITLSEPNTTSSTDS